MKKALTILIVATVLWFIGATQWYVCNIQYLCSSTSPAQVADTSDNPSVFERVFGIDNDAITVDQPAGFQAQTIHFAPDATDFADPQEATQVAATIMSYAKDHPDAVFVIAGYTADIGGACADCEWLSQMRAQVVRDMLVSEGVDENNITVRAGALEDPVADNSTPEGLAANRRVEITLAQ